ncbi:MAG: hypothetical protein LBN95_13135 [Prevotellaceae bacterium]|jgi:hypothetical protein|nr:hypothetical protein [Prevotellaceae bacterium]
MALKHSIFCIFCLLAGNFIVSAQTNVTPCDATVLCESATLNNSYPTYSNSFAIHTICDNGRVFNRCVFYKLIVKTSGTFSFKIKPQAASDYDWAVWKNVDCNNISNVNVKPVRYSSNDGINSQLAGVTTNWDTGMSASATVTCDPAGGYTNGMTSQLPVVAGDEILIAIDLAQDELSGYQLVFDGNFPTSDIIGSDFLCIEEYGTYTVCDFGNDGTEYFNLNILRNHLLQNYLNGASGYNIVFYAQETDILAGTPVITQTTITSAGKRVFCTITSSDRQEILSINLVLAGTSETIENLTLCENDLPFTWRGNIIPVGTVSDTITYNRTNVAGCDSIVHLNLTVNDTVIENVFIEVCPIQLPYTWRDKILPLGTTSGVITYNETTIDGCDSTVILDVLITNILTKTLNVELCDGESFNFRGTEFSRTGIYRDTVMLFVDCDSIITLNLTIKPILQYSYSEIICNNDIYDFNGRMLNETGIYIDTVISSFGCDSIVTLDLRVVTLQQHTASVVQSIICADDGIFDINFTPVNQFFDLLPSYYSIVFNQKSLNAGFENLYEDFVNSVQIDFSTNIYPDNYGGEIIIYDTIADCARQIIPFNVDIYYPNGIMEQKWNDVIALKNSYYNGGYEFAGYQWYQNGAILSGETKSYIYLKDKALNVGDEYYVNLTRADGSTMFSCPFIAHDPKPTVSLFPTIVQNGNVITIYLTKNAIDARLWTVTGILLENVKVRDVPVHQINAPNTAGVYLLEIQLDEGSRRVFDILVQ